MGREGKERGEEEESHGRTETLLGRIAANSPCEQYTCCHDMNIHLPWPYHEHAKMKELMTRRMDSGGMEKRNGATVAHKLFWDELLGTHPDLSQKPRRGKEW